MAFNPYVACRMIAGMSEHRIYFRQWRKHRGFTQDEVLNRLAIFEDPLIPKTNASLSRIENGKQIYTQRILEALAEIYDCEPSELLSRDPTKAGQVIDMVARLNAINQAKVEAFIRGLEAGDGTNGK